MKHLYFVVILSVTVNCVYGQFITPPSGSTYPPGGLNWQNCTKPNEYYDCSSPCQNECSTLGEPCNVFSYRCVDTCYCIKGYARDHNGVCIPEKDCPKKPCGTCTGPNEVFDCGSACQTECKTLGQQCPIINKKCNEGCYCIKGYARNDVGLCIPIDYCPVKECIGPNEYFDCGSACQTECKSLGKPCSIVNIKCNEGCYCIKGYARNATGVCIPINKCPKQPPPGKSCPGLNEFYSCGSACQTECRTLGRPCPIINVACNNGCYCLPGYARNDSGVCIPISQCPVVKPPIDCKGPNEFYDCGSACQTECRTLGEECPIINVKCNEGCYCIKGYARDNNGVCIPIQKCPKKPPIVCNRPNEFFSCGSACQTECKTLGQDCPIKNIKCNEGCYCIDGYARDHSGRCIPIDCCPKNSSTVCPRPNEFYSSCGSPCQTECSTLGDPCTIVNVKCNEACYCLEGYARDHSGLCVPIEFCPKKPVCRRPNEYFTTCGRPCQTLCRTLGETCPKQNVKCNEGCYCIQGYARDDNGLCIPQERCPKVLFTHSL